MTQAPRLRASADGGGSGLPTIFRGIPRLARGYGAVAVSLALAALGHAAAGGDLPPVAALLVPFLLTGFLGVLLAGRALGWFRTFACVGASQGAFHLMFTALSGASAPGAQFPGLGGHHHGDIPLSLDTVVPIVSPASSPWTNSWTMAAAHLLAAVLAVFLIRHGEKGVLALAAPLLRPFLLLWRTLSVTPSGPALLPGPVDAFFHLPPAPWLRAVSRRGPPVMVRQRTITSHP